MFATQHYMDVMSEPGRKRGREGEDAAGSGPVGLEEHRNKRIQSLPFRTSPRSNQQWQLQSSVASYNSDSDEHNAPSHFSHCPELHIVMDSPPAPAFYPDGHDPTGRMPTPIQPSFAAQVRGQQCEWAGPGPVVTTLNGVVNMGHHPSGFSDNQCVPRAMSAVSDWQALQSNRRLPTPISEAEDSALAPGGGSSMMIDDNNIPMTMEEPSSSTEHLSPPRPMDHPNAMMDVESPSQLQPAESDSDPSSPSPARRGHIRSKHTINNWTWQPGMKRSFSIGYRADCEKCRLKVPGHFNHIIIS